MSNVDIQLGKLLRRGGCTLSNFDLEISLKNISEHDLKDILPTKLAFIQLKLPFAFLLLSGFEYNIYQHV